MPDTRSGKAVLHPGLVPFPSSSSSATWPIFPSRPLPGGFRTYPRPWAGVRFFSGFPEPQPQVRGRLVDVAGTPRHWFASVDQVRIAGRLARTPVHVWWGGLLGLLHDMAELAQRHQHWFLEVPRVPSSAIHVLTHSSVPRAANVSRCVFYETTHESIAAARSWRGSWQIAMQTSSLGAILTIAPATAAWRLVRSRIGRY